MTEPWWFQGARNCGRQSQPCGSLWLAAPTGSAHRFPPVIILRRSSPPLIFPQRILVLFITSALVGLLRPARFLIPCCPGTFAVHDFSSVADQDGPFVGHDVPAFPDQDWHICCGRFLSALGSNFRASAGAAGLASFTGDPRSTGKNWQSI